MEFILLIVGFVLVLSLWGGGKQKHEDEQL